MTIRFQPLPTEEVRRIRAGGPDAYGNAAEPGGLSEGVGVPCRHCLRNVPKGRPYLILAHRPFPEPQPYAETGPIFLCADDCQAGGGEAVPEILTISPDYLLKGYSDRHRIVYGTGKVVSKDTLTDYAASLLSDERIAFVDVRSARNNCFQVRITRGD